MSGGVAQSVSVSPYYFLVSSNEVSATLTLSDINVWLLFQHGKMSPHFMSNIPCLQIITALCLNILCLCPLVITWLQYVCVIVYISGLSDSEHII